MAPWLPSLCIFDDRQGHELAGAGGLRGRRTELSSWSTVGRRDLRTKSSHDRSPGHHPEWLAQEGLGPTRPNYPSSALPRPRQFARGARATAKQVVNPARSFSRCEMYCLTVCGRRGEGWCRKVRPPPGESESLGGDPQLPGSKKKNASFCAITPVLDYGQQ